MQAIINFSIISFFSLFLVIGCYDSILDDNQFSCEDGIQNRDEEDIDCGGSYCANCPVGMEGVWISELGNLATVFSALGIQSNSYELRPDSTYIQITTTTSSITTTTGTFTQQESSYIDPNTGSAIWSIVFTPDPNSISSSIGTGIFTIDSNSEPKVLKFEIIFSDDVNNPPPSPAGGFGTFGNGANTQFFVKTQ